MERIRRGWTGWEDYILRSNYLTVSDEDLAIMLGRKKRSIVSHRIRLGLLRVTGVTKLNNTEKSFIVRNSPYISSYKIAKILNRSEGAVREYINKKGIHYKLTG